MIPYRKQGEKRYKTLAPETTMKTAYKTEAAQVAALIKAELKEKFPGTVFSVKSQTYAGGDSVTIYYTATVNGPKISAVELVGSKYKAGHFDGSIDCYEYTNRGTGPTAKYIFVDADTRALQESLKDEFMRYWGITEEQYANKHSVWFNNGWLSMLEHRFIHDKIK